MQRSSTTTATQQPNRYRLEPLAESYKRANSAQANLQSHPCFQSSLFNDKERAAGSLKLWKERQAQERLAYHTPSSSEGVRKAIVKDYQLENVIWTESVKQPRRLTLTNTQNITDWEIVLLKRQKSYAVAALGELKGKLEEKLNLDALNELHMAFIEADADGSGTLELDEFKEVVRNALKIQGRNDEEIAALFMKINFSSDGKITWDEFCTFMQLNFSEKEDTIRRSKEVVFITPARTENNPHRNSVQKILYNTDFNYMMMSSDGILSVWNPVGDLKRIKKEIIEKRVVVKEKGDKQESKRTRPKWITDFLVISEFNLNKIVIGTGDRELQFWEMTSFEPYCQICSLHTVPIKLAYCFSGKDDITITYGDTDGCVNILIFSSIGETLRLWKTAPLIAQMPSIHLDKALEATTLKYTRWKAHNDWVEQIRIDGRLNQIISCSNDEHHAVIIGCILPSTDVNSHLQQVAASGQNVQLSESLGSSQGLGASVGLSAPGTAPGTSQSVHNPNTATTQPNSSTNNQNFLTVPQAQTRTQTPNQTPQIQTQQATPPANTVSLSSRDVKRRPDVNETVFKVNKGVKTFDFSFDKNLLITGGMDRIVRLYNPYVPSRPIAHLKHHATPIFYIHLCNEDNRIFTMSTDKCLNVWDVVDHSCLASIRPKSHKINGELQACCYNPKSKTLLISTDKVSFLSLKLKTNLHTEVVLSHKEPVVCCLYNRQFKQLVSCTEAGCVKLWDVETGRDIFEFSNAHGDQAVTCMTFDDSGRRLITGGRDGLCKIWNFNNGHCLKILRKDNQQEINDVKYTKIYNNKFIVNVGWDRSINIYDDDMSDVRLYTDPIPRWQDDIDNGHREDILCLAKSESNFLATSGYDGEIIIWNMVSGHIFCKLHSPKPANYRDDNLDGDLSVNKLLFFNKERFTDKSSAHLISSGPWGMIHFWSVFHGAAIWARFPVGDKKGTNIVKMCMDSKCLSLFAADNHGYIYHWDIEGYATKHKEIDPPQLIKCWRAHTQNIGAIEYIETAKVLITSSADCTIRVWTPDGKYIGTFGQEEIWNLYDSKTYKHPLVPYDVLIDEQSLPEHPILNKRETLQEVLEETKIMEKQQKEQEKAAKVMTNNSKNNFIDDETIVKQIKNMGIPTKVGKRLRHEITKPMVTMDKGAKNYYQMLKCFEYDPKPVQVKVPSFISGRSKAENRYSTNF